VHARDTIITDSRIIVDAGQVTDFDPTSRNKWPPRRGTPFLSNKNKENARVMAGQASCAIGIDRDLSRTEIHMRMAFFLLSIRTRK